MIDYEYSKFSDLQGKILKSVEVNRSGADDDIVFVTEAGETYRMFHHQDCCENVYIESFLGDAEDLIGTPILVAEERVSEEPPVQILVETAAKGETYFPSNDSERWTFYTIRTIKGSVDIRWHGSSNGYYSESVSFEKIG